MRDFPPTSRTTSIVVPSGAQSTSWIPSATSRGDPPVSAARASVPAQTPGWFDRQSTAMAISPEGEIPSRFALGSASGSESGLDGCLRKSLSGPPSQPALKTIVCPSGAKRAERIVPLPNVICW